MEAAEIAVVLIQPLQHARDFGGAARLRRAAEALGDGIPQESLREAEGASELHRSTARIGISL